MRSLKRPFRPLLLNARPSLNQTRRRTLHSTTATDLSLPDQPSTPPRLRFAPSPTGLLHLGGLRTALFNHLLARKWGGKWVLRVEDTDQARLVPGSVENVMKTLDWAGLDYDEGPDRPGSLGPYTQSDRLEIYNHHLTHLLSSDRAYPCFCTPSELLEIQKSQLAQKRSAAYDGRCRHLTEGEVGRRKKAGEKYVVRFKAPDVVPPTPRDLVFGEYSNKRADHSGKPSAGTIPYDASKLSSSLLSSDTPRPKSETDGEKDAESGEEGDGLFFTAEREDFIIIKSDGFPTYHFASVVDDHMMEISHVLRGEEWLPSTTKHIQMYQALGWEPPKFCHLPLLINADGSKLSKRSGEVAVEEYIKKGYEPGALLNFLALMGWNHLSPSATSLTPSFFPPTPTTSTSPHIHLTAGLHSHSELFTLPSLIQAFDLPAIGRRRAIVNFEKLDWVNRMWLRREMALEGGRARLVDRFQGSLRGKKVGMKQGEEKVGLGERVEDKEFLGKVLDAELSRVNVLKEMPDMTINFFLPPKLDSLEATTLHKTMDKFEYERVIETAISEMESDPLSTWSSGVVWDIIHRLLTLLGIKRKPQVITPLRHAIMGRKEGSGLPATMAMLGKEECFERLDRALAWSKGVERTGERRKRKIEPAKVGEVVKKAVVQPGLMEDLESRGFVAALTGDGIRTLVESPTTVYAGVDPSAKSLHVGNLLPLLVLLHFQIRGHKALALIGGATGSIGDPSGRSTERNALDSTELALNQQAITLQVKQFLSRAGSYAEKKELYQPKRGMGSATVLNNYDWFKDISFLDFLRTTGKHARVNTMIARDSVKNRLDSAQGISFTEFSYQLLQAHDFQVLHKEHGCRIQVGGSDQWGNIVAGIDLIRRAKPSASRAVDGTPVKDDAPAFGLTIPLLTTSSGEKFGKSAGNAVWLDASMTSPFMFYQYFLRTADADVEKYLKLFTLVSLEEIADVMAKHLIHPESRLPHTLLADELTYIVHGQSALSNAQAATAALYKGDFSNHTAAEIIAMFEGDPRLYRVSRKDVIGQRLGQILRDGGHAKTISDVTRMMRQGGFQLNGRKIDDSSRTFEVEDLREGKLAVFRMGKGTHVFIHVTD